MKTLVIYDSTYGNTEQVARAMAQALGGPARKVGAQTPEDLQGLDVLIVGSPTHGGRPTPEVQALLKSPLSLGGARVAAFDTRVNSRVGEVLFGFAADRIGRLLEQGGATLRVKPEGFFVLGNRGPVKPGELERAAAWARQVAG